MAVTARHPRAPRATFLAKNPLDFHALVRAVTAVHGGLGYDPDRGGHPASNQGNTLGQETTMARIDGNWWGETLDGTDNDDEIFGDGGDDTISGGDGNDLLRGDSGNDAIFGGNGNDDIQGGSGDDFLSGGAGSDDIVATSGVDEVSGGSGNDDIRVRGGDWFRFDRVDGGSGNDVLDIDDAKVIAFGGSGNDTIETDLAKEQVLVGGTGSDRFVITGGAIGSGRVAELHGGDAIVVTSSAFGVESIANVTLGGDTSVDTLDLSELSGMGFGTLEVNLNAGTLHERETNVGTTTRVHMANMTGIENVEGSSGREEMTGNSVANVLDGNGGNDFLDGLGGNDTLRGGAGNDGLEGGTEHDTLFGEAGDDNLFGESGDDALFGGEGADDLFGNAGADVLNGEAGDDTLDGGSGGDIVNGGAGSDTINGGSGDDIVYGDFYGDAVSTDTLSGGTGADRFVFVDVANTTTVQQVETRFGTWTAILRTPVVDTVTDFDTSGSDHDTIDIAYLMATKTSFTGSTFQQAVDQGYLFFVQHGTPGSADFGTKVMIDTNGGTHVDAATNYVVADLKGVFASEMRADLFIV